jgi:hypothetical protein
MRRPRSTRVPLPAVERLPGTSNAVGADAPTARVRGLHWRYWYVHGLELYLRTPDEGNAKALREMYPGQCEEVPETAWREGHLERKPYHVFKPVNIPKEGVEWIPAEYWRSIIQWMGPDTPKAIEMIWWLFFIYHYSPEHLLDLLSVKD